MSLVPGLSAVPAERDPAGAAGEAPARPPMALSGRGKLLLGGAVALLTGLAWLRRFVLDDAFISFRYADHLARGLGLVWNPGEPIEGYTNFLWTVWMALPHRLGLEPVAFAWASGLVLFAAGLALTFRLARRLLGEPACWAVLLLVGAHPTYSAYATSGLETQLVAVLYLACAWRALVLSEAAAWRPAPSVALSLLFAAALLTRLDAAVMVAVVGGATLAALWRAPLSGRARARAAAALIGPGLLVVAAWMLWKLAAYGSILPNTFHVKTAGPGRLAVGLRFVGHFFASYGYALFLLPAALFAGRLRRSGDRRLAVAALLVAAWIGYLVWAGGDFMEFRFFVPILPFLMILLVFVAWAVSRSAAIRLALVLLLAAGSLRHALFFDRRDGIDRIQTLAALLDSPARDWDGVGRRLGELFDRPGCEVVIATTAAGAIPYYSRLETVDMLGLNDPWIARHGRRFGDRVGHTRMAPLDYLLRRRVDLVLGNPWVVPVDSREHRRAAPLFLYAFAHPPELLPPGARFLEIPVGAGYKLTVLSAGEDACVERAAAAEGWPSFPVPRPGSG